MAADAPRGDRLNLTFMNTMLTRGRAELIVTATVPSTEMGRLSRCGLAGLSAIISLQNHRGESK